MNRELSRITMQMAWIVCLLGNLNRNLCYYTRSFRIPIKYIPVDIRKTAFCKYIIIFMNTESPLIWSKWEHVAGKAVSALDLGPRGLGFETRLGYCVNCILASLHPGVKRVPRTPPLDLLRVMSNHHIFQNYLKTLSSVLATQSFPPFNSIIQV